jgi:tRNA uridine 5-carbamoylmethylation protein Kti12
MPLIVISGGPCSGKSTRAQGLYEYFQKKSMPVQMITDNHLDRNAVYAGFYSDIWNQFKFQ